MKSTTERILSAGLIRMNPMHSGYEVFLMQWINFQGHMNQGRKPYKCGVIQRVRGTLRACLPQLVHNPCATKPLNVQNRRIGGRRANAFPLILNLAFAPVPDPLTEGMATTVGEGRAWGARIGCRLGLIPVSARPGLYGSRPHHAPIKGKELPTLVHG